MFAKSRSPTSSRDASGVRPARRLIRELADLYWASGLSNDVPALAWFLLVSLVPLALGLTALAAVLLGDYAQAQALAARAARVLPKDVHDQLVALVLRTRRNSPLLIALSVAAMVWVSSGAVAVIERYLSRLLSSEHKGLALRAMAVGKLRQLALAGALALVIVLLVLGASAGTGLVDRLHVDSTLVRVLTPLVSLAVCVVFCAALYRFASRAELAVRPALAGGVIGGSILLATPTLAGYYTRLVASRTPVGVFLVLAGVIFTCYVVALGLLLGAGVGARVQLGKPLGE